MFFRNFLAEIKKIFGRPSTWVLCAIWMASSIFFAYVIPYVTYSSAGSDVPEKQLRLDLLSMLPEQVYAVTIAGFPIFGSAIAVVLGVLSIGSEFEWGTLKTVFSLQPNRLLVMVNKMVALALAVLLFVLAILVANSVSSLVIAMVKGASVNWPPIQDGVLVLLAGWLIMGVWAAFGFLLATLLRGTGIAIGLGLVYVLAVEALLGFAAQISDLVKTFVKWLPRSNAGSLAAALVPEWLNRPGVQPTVASSQAILVLCVYLALFLLVSIVIMIRRDIQ